MGGLSTEGPVTVVRTLDTELLANPGEKSKSTKANPPSTLGSLRSPDNKKREHLLFLKYLWGMCRGVGGYLGVFVGGVWGVFGGVFRRFFRDNITHKHQYKKTHKTIILSYISRFFPSGDGSSILYTYGQTKG